MQLSPTVNPYPSQYCYELQLRDGTALDVRPIRPEDEPLLAEFHFTLSDESVYLRYFGFLNIAARIRHERLTKLCCIDYEHEMAYIALTPGAIVPVTGERSKAAIVGVARLIESGDSGEAEVAAVISDAFQFQGIGSSLMTAFSISPGTRSCRVLRLLSCLRIELCSGCSNIRASSSYWTRTMR